MQTYKKNKREKDNYFFLFLIFVNILIYSIQDVRTSSNIGLKYANRQNVYISLFIIILLLGVHYYFTLFSRGVLKGSIQKYLWAIFIWIIMVDLIQAADLWDALVHIGLSLLWILVFSFFSYYVRQHPDSWSKILKYIVIMFLFYVIMAIFAKYNIQKTYNRIAVVNMVYNVLVFVPWLTMIKNNKMRKIYLLIALITVMISMKRGAIITFPIMIFAYYIIDGYTKGKTQKAIIKSFCLLFIFFMILLIFDFYTNGYLSSRFTYESLASGSGRNILYASSIVNIKNRNMFDLLIGLGSGSSIYYLGTVTHNEWLEFLFSFGIIGVLLYLLLTLSICKRAYKLLKNKSSYSAALILAFIYMFIVGMIGMIYFAHSTLYIMALYGSIEGQMYNDYYKEKDITKNI